MLALWIIIGHGVGLEFAWMVAPLVQSDRLLELGVTAIMVAVVGPVLIMMGLAQTLRSFLLRGDLVLLLSSPLSPRLIMGTRLIGGASTQASLLATIILPVANGFVLLGHPGVLALYPLLPCFCLAGAGAGLILLFVAGKIPPRPKTTGSQIIRAFLGGFCLLVSLPVLATGLFARAIANLSAGQPIMTPWWEAALCWPGRAFMGAPGPLIALMLLSLCLFLLATLSLAGPVLRSLQQANRHPEPRHQATPPPDIQFQTRPFPTLVRHHWRLLRREPGGLVTLAAIGVGLANLGARLTPHALDGATTALVSLPAFGAAWVMAGMTEAAAASPLLAVAPISPRLILFARLRVTASLILPALGLASLIGWPLPAGRWWLLLGSGLGSAISGSALAVTGTGRRPALFLSLALAWQAVPALAPTEPVVAIGIAGSLTLCPLVIAGRALRHRPSGRAAG